MKHKILVVKPELDQTAWNKHLPVPLRGGEKAIVDSSQDGVKEGFVRVKHGPPEGKVKSVFSIGHFTDVAGNDISAD